MIYKFFYIDFDIEKDRHVTMIYKIFYIDFDIEKDRHVTMIYKIFYIDFDIEKVRHVIIDLYSLLGFNIRSEKFNRLGVTIHFGVIHGFFKVIGAIGDEQLYTVYMAVVTSKPESHV